MSKCQPLLIPFIVSRDLSFVVEISYNKIKFLVDHGKLIHNENEYSISSPYKYNDLFDENGISRIQYVQNGDILYLFHEEYPVKKLTRYSNTSWVISDMEFSAPWDYPNTDETIKLTVNNIDGTATITASAGIFTEDKLNKYIRLTEEDSDIKPWVAEKSYNSGDTVKSDGKQYIATNTATSGTVKPVHSRGTVTDGGVKWQYKNAGYGVLKITEINSAISATATIIESLPQSIKDEGTTYFEWSIFSGTIKSYPIAGTFFRNRFCILAQTDNVPTVYCSCSEDYENFADKDEGQVLATNAITIPLTSGSYNKACWIYGSDVLFAGTSTAEYAIDSASAAEAFAPDNNKSQIISEIGSLPIKPVKIGAQLLFVSKNGKEIRDILYSFATDAYETSTMSLQGRHLLESGIIDIVYQESPEKILWVLTQKRLVGITYSKENEVIAFHRQNLSGKVERFTVIPNIHNKLDELWVEVNRGNTRTIEWIDNNFFDFPDDEELDNPVIQESKEALFVKDNSCYLDGSVEGYYDDAKNFQATITFVDTFSGGGFRNIDVYTNTNDKETRNVSPEKPNLDIDITTGDILNRHRRASEVVLEWEANAFDNNRIVAKVSSELIGYNYELYKNDELVASDIIHNDIEVTVDMDFGISKFKLYIYKVIDESGFRTVTGLSHLEGMLVSIMADGAELESQTVQNGAVIISKRYHKIMVGLPIESQYIPQTIYIQANNGAGVGDVQRIDHVTLMLWRSMGGKVGEDFDKLQDIYFRGTDEPMGKSSHLYTGNKEIPVDMRTSFIKEKGATVLIHNDSVYPMNILAIAPHFTTSGNGK